MINWFKYLKRLRKGEQLKLLASIHLIQLGRIEGFDMKKLVNHENLYRIRIGKFRIIYKKEGDSNKIIDLDERNDNTYKNL